MSKTIIANWKSHPATLAEAQELFKAEVEAAQKYPNVQTVLCPPDNFLDQLGGGGAQDVFWENTPPVVSHVLVGHSDRRYGLGETDETINSKLKKTLATEVVPVLLVGERDGEDMKEILQNQLKKDLADLSPSQISKILFTYEPVWAISTNPGGHADTPDNAVEAIRFVKNFLAENYQIENAEYFYGGSINENNVTGFLKYQEISGAVVGKASLDPNQFANILKIVSTL